MTDAKKHGERMKKKKSLTAKNKELRERIKELEQELNEIKADREKYRTHFITRFRWWIELLGKGSTPNVNYLIESDAKILNSTKPFWWG